MGTSLMRQLRFVAVGALRKRLPFQVVMGTAPVAACSRMSSFRIWHLSISFESCCLAALESCEAGFSHGSATAQLATDANLSSLAFITSGSDFLQESEGRIFVQR